MYLHPDQRIVMQLAFSTNAYLKHPFDEAAARIAGHRLRGAGAAGRRAPRLAGGPARRPEARDPRGDGALGSAFSNINAFMMNAINDHRQPYWHPSFIEPDPHYRQVRIDHTRRALRSAPSWGRRTSPPSRAGRWRRGSRGRQAIDLFVEVLKPLAEHAHDCGVLLLIEPEPGLLLETTDQYLEVAERVESPRRSA